MSFCLLSLKCFENLPAIEMQSRISAHVPGMVSLQAVLRKPVGLLDKTDKFQNSAEFWQLAGQYVQRKKYPDLLL